jgi:hypothetical protein
MRKVALLALVFIVTGCLSMQSQNPLDELGKNGQPFVEGYIEYPGPNSRWMGPPSFVMKISAKDAGMAQISVAPAIFKGAESGGTRALANAPKGMTGETARELLAKLASSLQGAEGVFRGCLAPVRVRLVQADGTLLEKSGCRGQSGWTRVASDAVNAFITATLHGPEASRVIASPQDAIEE